MYLPFKNEETIQAISVINFDLSNPKINSITYCLQLNFNKSNIMVFGRGEDKSKFLSRHKKSIRIDNDVIPIYDTFRNLDLTMVRSLNAHRI